MKSINIIDEIIHCLKTLAQTGADTSMSEDVLNDFLNDYPHSALASACSLNTPEWETLRAECASWMKCGLGRIRTDKVFADGNPHAELLFIGAAPAPNDMDLPPGGNADELLTRMISAMTFGAVHLLPDRAGPFFPGARFPDVRRTLSEAGLQRYPFEHGSHI